jgi:uncharacterized delta-60 repeat protein
MLCLCLTTCQRQIQIESKTAGSPAQDTLVFIAQPKTGPSNSPFTVDVAVKTSAGELVTNFKDPISLYEYSETDSKILSGILTAEPVQGIARFTGLSLSTPGSGYRLVASASSLVPVISEPFDIVAPLLSSSNFVSGIDHLKLEGPSEVLAKTCAVFTLSLRDQADNVVPAPRDLSFMLSFVDIEPSMAGISSFVSTSDWCSPTEGKTITQLSFPAGTLSQTFYLKPGSGLLSFQIKIVAEQQGIAQPIAQSETIEINRRQGVAGDLDTSFAGDRYNFFLGIYQESPLYQTGKVGIAYPGGLTKRLEPTGNITVQPNGKILVSGESNIYPIPSGFPNQKAFNLFQLKSDGSLDAQFGRAGFVETIFDASGNLIPPNLDLNSSSINSSSAAIANHTLQADGKVLAFGSNKLLRYHSNGAIDRSFIDQKAKIASDAGLIRPDFVAETQNLVAPSFVKSAAAPDGKIILVGSTSTSPSKIAVASLNPDGSFDTSFGSQGQIVAPQLGISDWGRAVAVQKDGKILVAADTQTKGIAQDFPEDPSGLATNVASGSFEIAVLRFLPDGRLDPVFGQDGRVLVKFHEGYSRANQIEIQADGKIIVVGSTADVNGPVMSGILNTDFAVLRFNSDGSLDRSFTGGQDNPFLGTGKVVSNITRYSNGDPSSDMATDVKIQADGKILVAGPITCTTPSNNRSMAAIIRYNTDGSPDSEFHPSHQISAHTTDGQSHSYNSISSDGIFLSYYNSGGNPSHCKYEQLAIQPNGKLILSCVSWALSGGNYWGALILRLWP